MTKLKISQDMWIGCSSQMDAVFLPITIDPASGLESPWKSEDGQDYNHHLNHFQHQQPLLSNDNVGVSAGTGCGKCPENTTDEVTGLSNVLLHAIVTGKPDSNDWCYRASLTSAAVIVAMLVFLVLGHHYICSVIVWLEKADPTVSVSVLAAMFVVVCFPVVWGLTLLMVSAGYLYGMLYGPAVVAVSVTMGLAISTPVMRAMCSGYVRSHFYSPKVEVIVNVVSGPHGMRIIALTRLTPIPFGLQNALFSLSSISLLRYLAFSALGLIPMTLLNCYMGSSLRSIKDFMMDGSNSLAGFLVFGGQILITVILLWLMVRKARVELKKAMDETDNLPVALPSHDCSDTVLQVGL